MEAVMLVFGILALIGIINWNRKNGLVESFKVSGGDIMHRHIRTVLRFIIRNNSVYKIFRKWKWFNNLIYEEAQAVIGNRPWH